MNEFAFINVVSLIVEQDSMLSLCETVPDLVVSSRVGLAVRASEGQEGLGERTGGLYGHCGIWDPESNHGLV